VGDCLSASHAFDTELVSKVVSELHQGKAPDIVGLTGEHLQFCHCSVLVLLTKLFQLSGCSNIYFTTNGSTQNKAKKKRTNLSKRNIQRKKVNQTWLCP